MLKQRLDAFRSLITNIGARGRDPRMTATATDVIKLTEQYLSCLFDGDTLARKAVLKPIQAEFRNWVEFQNVEGMEEYVDDHNIKKILREARIWEDVFGGSAIMVHVDDGTTGADGVFDPSIPINEEGIKTIHGYTVFNRFQLHRVHGTDDMFERTKDQVKIHESRLIVFPGPLTTHWTRTRREGWGVSVYETAYERLRDSSHAFGAISALPLSFVQSVYRLKNLGEIVSQGHKQTILDRLSVIDEGRSVINAMVLDADQEDFTTSSTNVAGLPELVDRLMMLTAEAFDMPVSVLFGRAPAGMNATGESDMQLWHERIADQQEERSRPRFESLFRLMLLSKDGPTKGVEPEDWRFTFGSLTRPDQQEQAAIHFAQAQADAIYLDRGVLSPNEIRESRFADDYSTATELGEEGEIDLLAELDAARQQLEAERLNAAMAQAGSGDDDDRE